MAYLPLVRYASSAVIIANVVDAVLESADSLAILAEI